LQHIRKNSKKWSGNPLIKKDFKTLSTYGHIIHIFNTNISLNLSILFLTQIISSCAPQMTKISSRNPDLIEKEKDPIDRADASITNVSPELYVKEPRINIQPSQGDSSNGSLASVDDDRLNLFGDVRPRKIGRHINVFVASNKTNTSKDSAENKDADSAKSEEKNSADKKVDPLEEELLKSLPDLTPAQKESAKLLKNFKMQITHRYPNGDLMARVARSSNNPDSSESFVAEAKIPAERLASGDPITTEDLVDVTVTENHAGEVVERRSTIWEDEYSLRLSGFTEAKSRAGLDLEEKRKELGDARDRLEQRIKDFAAEKRQFAVQRDQLKKESSGTNDLPKSQSSDQAPGGLSKVPGSNDQGTQPPSPKNISSEPDGKSAQPQAPKGGNNG
jgi:flagellar basal body L-ring protein FlgH